MPSQRDNRGRYLPRDSAGGPGKDSGGSAPAAPGKDWLKSFRDSAKAASGMEHSLSEMNMGLQNAGKLGQLSSSHMADLARGMKLGGKGASFLEAETLALQKAQANQLATQDKGAGATERAGMGMSAQIEILKMVAGAAWAATKAIVGLGASFATVTLEAVDFRQGTAQAIDTLTKKKGEGDKAVEVGIELAARFHFDPHQAVASMHELISKGFTTEKSQLLITALADLKVLSPKANIDALTLAIGQIKGKGKLQMEELSGQIAEAGLATGLVIDQLAAKYGKTSDQVRKMISAGKVNAEDGIDAILAAIAKMGGGKLGDAAEKAARGTVGGLVAGIKTRLGIIPLEMARTLASGTGVGAIKGTLGQLLDALNPTKTPEMKGMISAFAVFANTLFTVLFGGTASADAGKTLLRVITAITSGVKTITAVVASVGPIVMAFAGGLIDGMVDVAAIFAEVGSVLADVFGGEAMSAADIARTLGKGLAYVAGVAVLVVGAVAALAAGGATMIASFISPAIAGFGVFTGLLASTSALFSALPSKAQSAASSIGDRLGAAVIRGLQAIGGVVDWVQSLPGQLLAAGLSMGSNLWAGFVAGIQAGISAVTEAGNQLANAAKSAVSTSLTIRSPSRVMAEMGGYTAEGFAMGVDGGQGQVDAAMNALVSPQAPTGSPAAGGAVGAGAAFSITVGDIHVHVGSNGNPSAQDIGKSVKQEVRDLFDDLLAQMGVSPSPA